MSYRLRNNESVGAGVARTIREQIDAAISELTDTQMPGAEAVHQVRKRCKKVRAVLRLVHDRLGDYPEQNALFRDLAQSIAGARDTAVMLKTYDELAQSLASPPNADAEVRRQLNNGNEITTDDTPDLDRTLHEAIATLRAARPRYEAPAFGRGGNGALAKGLRKTLRTARKRKTRATKQPSTEAFHEWRKGVKNDWYHTRLLQDAAPRVMKARRKVLRQLAETLGNEHDLATLSNHLRNDPDRHNGSPAMKNTLKLIDRRRKILRTKARQLGKKIYASKSDRLIERVGKYWKK